MQTVLVSFTLSVRESWGSHFFCCTEISRQILDEPVHKCPAFIWFCGWICRTRFMWNKGFRREVRTICLRLLSLLSQMAHRVWPFWWYNPLYCITVSLLLKFYILAPCFGIHVLSCLIFNTSILVSCYWLLVTGPSHKVYLWQETSRVTSATYAHVVYGTYAHGCSIYAHVVYGTYSHVV